MRIAVFDLFTGDVDILVLDSKAEEAFDEYDDASDFFKDLGYSVNNISWGVAGGLIRETKVTARNSRPEFVD